jgi:hypothetical protein
MPWVIGNHKGRTETTPAAHGTAGRYRNGCRCDGCRSAYADVQRDRRARMKTQDGDFTVSAELARQHLIELRMAGVGKRAVSDCTGISDVVLMEIRNGKRQRIRQSTEEKIMRITEDARSGGALVDGGPSTRLIQELMARGYTMAQLATNLGYKDKRIQFFGCKYVTATNAMRVERMHKLLMRERPESVSRVERMMILTAKVERLRKWDGRAA